MRYVCIFVKGLQIKSSEAQQLGDSQMLNQKAYLMVEEFCHILFEKTTMYAYENIALVMISAKSKQITSIHG